MSSSEHSLSDIPYQNAKIPLAQLSVLYAPAEYAIHPSTKPEDIKPLPAHEAEFCLAALVQTAHALTGRATPDKYEVVTTGVALDGQMPLPYQDVLGYGHKGAAFKAEMQAGIGAVDVQIALRGGRDTSNVRLSASAPSNATPWDELEFLLTRENSTVPHAILHGEQVGEVLFSLMPHLIQWGDKAPGRNISAIGRVSELFTAVEKPRNARTTSRKSYHARDTAYPFTDADIELARQLEHDIDTALAELSGQSKPEFEELSLNEVRSKLIVTTDSASKRATSCSLTRIVPWPLGDQMGISLTRLAVPNLVTRIPYLYHSFGGQNIRPEVLEHYAKLAAEKATPAAIHDSLIHQLETHGLDTGRVRIEDEDQITRREDVPHTPFNNMLYKMAFDKTYDIRTNVP